jgi:hypothetical protein
VVDLDTGVDNVHAGSLAGGAVVQVVGGAILSVGDACNAPGRALLRQVLEQVDLLVVLNIIDLSLLAPNYDTPGY